MLQNQDFDKANFTPNEKNDFFTHLYKFSIFREKVMGSLRVQFIYLSLTCTVAVHFSFVVIMMVVNCYAFKK